MKRVIKHLHKTFAIILITVFLIISLGVLAINSPWGKHKIKSYVISFFNQTGYEIKIDKFLSKSPLDYHLKTIHVKISDTESIDIDEIKLTLSISSIFFKRKIIIDNFYAKNIDINILNKQNTPSILAKNNKISKKFEMSWPKFPFGISLNSFEIENLKVPINNNKTSFNISGDAHLRRSGNFNLNIKIEREKFEKSNVLVKLSGHEKSKQIVIKTYLKTKTLKVFSPFYDNKFDCETDIFISLKGHFKKFLNELNLSDQKHLEPILGKIDGNISSINFLKNKKVSIFSYFSIKEFLKFNKIEIKSSNFEIDGDLLLEKNFSLKNSNLRIKTQKIDEILPINKNIFYGDLDANLKLYSEDKSIFADINYELLNCEINNRYISTFKGILNSRYENKNIFSKINSEIILPNSSPLHLYADLKLFNFKNLLVENFSLKSTSTSSTGFLEFIDNKINGNFSGSFENAKELAYFLPFRPFQAKATFSLDFYTEKETNDQLANLSMDFTNFYISEIKGDHFNLNLKIFKPFQIPEFDVEIRGENSFYKKLKIEKILLKTQKQNNKYPINFQFTGFLHKNIDLYLRGFWDFRENNKISVKTLSGIFLDENITKSTPFDILITDDKFEIKNFDLEMEKSKLFSKISIIKDSADIFISAKNFPVDLFSLNPKDLDLSGFANFDLSLKKDKILTGNFTADLEKVLVQAILNEPPFSVSGKISSKIDKNYFNSRAKISINEKQALSFDSKIPININFHPFRLKFIDDKDFSANFNYTGKAEDFLDFLNIGSHKIEGNVKSQIKLSNTLKNLEVDGFLTLQNGIYENYYTGTFLYDVDAKFLAKNKTILLEKMVAKSSNDGDFSAKGNLELNKKLNYPFKLDTNFSNLLCIDNDLMNANASGKLLIDGNFTKAKAQGEIQIDTANINIPKRMPKYVPTLDVKFTNKKSSPAVSIVKPKIFPIDLDITIGAKDKIHIDGRGLSSEWRGDFTIKGSTENIIPKGSLDLIKGDFHFSGRYFELTKGSFVFPGIANAMPSIDVMAKMQEKGVTIYANLKGAVTTPQITFTSTPNLPLSSIMSILIFGHDLSEISPIQAAQIAATISSFTNAGDVLDKTKKSLGIDRLAIITTPSKNLDESDKLALQVGKYITRGILLSVSQGTEQGTSNLIIEVDLKNGFIFQAETESQQEQGKFTLKWNLNF